MTAGQRNCYLALKAEVEKYSLGDALFAVHELIREARDAGETCRTFYDLAMGDIGGASNWIREAEKQRAREAAAAS